MRLGDPKHLFGDRLERDAIAVLELAAGPGPKVGQDNENIAAAGKHELRPGLESQFGIKSFRLPAYVEGNILLGYQDISAGGTEDQVAGDIVLVGEVVGNPGAEAAGGEHGDAGSGICGPGWQLDCWQAAAPGSLGAAPVHECSDRFRAVVMVADESPDRVGVDMGVDGPAAAELHRNVVDRLVDQIVEAPQVVSADHGVLAIDHDDLGMVPGEGSAGGLAGAGSHGRGVDGETGARNVLRIADKLRQ